ncbi:MAG: ACP S-malonyltransferase [Peptostreptococcaceae bacterium]|nr:ACP S-malonyltransferase [Peptostreptococcaceae bacterium]
MSKIGFVYPGQGAQKVGMGKDFLTLEILNKAKLAVGIDFNEIILEENELINQTKYTQPAILLIEMLITDELIKSGIKPDLAAGLSLGEYGAIYASGGIEFYDALKAVSVRGKLMEEAVPLGVGTMAAILGLTGDKVEKVVSEIDGITVANYNTDTQIIITGKQMHMEEAITKLKLSGAKMCKELNVSGPFHSPMLIPAGEKLREALDNVDICDMKVPYVANVTAKIVNDKSEVRELLEKQVSSPVRWADSVKLMIEEGVDTFIEIGPSKTLTNMIKKIDKRVKIYNVETREDLEKLRGELNA